jgi:hypothetical protein
MVAPLEMHTSGFLTTPSQAPKVFTLRGMPGGGGLGTHLSGSPRPPQSYSATSLPQPRPTLLGSGQGSCSILGLVRLGVGTQWLYKSR